MGNCYQPAAGGPILNFVGGNFIITSVSNTSSLKSFSSTITGFSARQLQIGLGVYNLGTVPIDANDFVNGYVMVVN